MNGMFYCGYYTSDGYRGLILVKNPYTVIGFNDQGEPIYYGKYIEKWQLFPTIDEYYEYMNDFWKGEGYDVLSQM